MQRSVNGSHLANESAKPPHHEVVCLTQNSQASLSDPGVPTLILCTLDEIRPYDRNPRLAPNERYAEIKASIRVRELESPLPITRRPGDTSYMVGKGGNTRLAILNELYQETGEQRFFKFSCHFTPWVSESDTLLAHLTENDRRGDLTLIDRAHGVRDLHTLLEQELDRKLTLRELATELKALGYYQDPPRITRMYYALDVLLPAIPQLLATGMGRRQVEAIRRLDRAAHKVWQEAGIWDDFRPVFSALLQRLDGEYWDNDQLLAALIKEIEVSSDWDVVMIAQAFDRQLGSDSADLGAIDAKSVAILETSSKPLRSSTRSSLIKTEVEVPGDSASGDKPSKSALLKPLRRTACQLATRLAKRHALAEQVMPSRRSR